MRQFRASTIAGAVALVVYAVDTVAGGISAAQQTPSTTFRTATEYVEVDVRVFDDKDQPLRNLTQDRFRVFEDGVEQKIDRFEVIDLPRRAGAASVAARDGGAAPLPSNPTPDTASNQHRNADGVAYLLLVDDHFIAQSRTIVTRKLLHEFVDRHLEPGDTAALLTTGRSRVFQDFTSDRSRLNAAVDRLFGDSPGSPTVQELSSIEYKAATSTVGGDNPVVPPAAPRDTQIMPARDAQRLLARAAEAMNQLEARTRAILYVTEGSPVETISDAGATFFNENIGAGGRLNSAVPVYPIDPRGLTTLADESIQVGRVKIDDVPTTRLMDEIAEARNRMHRLADDTGGFVTTNNNTERAFTEIAQHAGVHYSLGYYPSNAKHDGKYRAIKVDVAVPGAKIVARRGYVAPDDRLKRSDAGGPAGLSPPVRDALNATFPLGGVGLALTAAAFRGTGSNASIAIVNEATALDAASLEVATTAVDGHSSIKASDAKKLQWSTGTAVGDRIREHGLRWLSRLTLRPGAYQLRVATGAGAKLGSVWLDLEVPDFSNGDLTMSGVLVSSAAAFTTPTYRPDPLLANALPGPPTTTRRFAAGDTVAVYCEIYDNARSGPQNVEATIAVDANGGRRVLSHTEVHGAEEAAKSRGMVRFRASLTVPAAAPGEYVLSISAQRPGAARPAVVRAIPFVIAS
jgi:VWFA-related protein